MLAAQHKQIVNMPELATFALITYCHEAFVVAALESVAKQTYRPLELVICDDGSSDRTRELIEQTLTSFPQDIHIVRIFHPKNLGFSSAINSAARRSSGRVVIFGAGDDVSAPDRVHRTMEEFRNPEVSFVYSAVLGIKADGRPAEEQQEQADDAIVHLNDLLSGYASPVIGASCAYSIGVFRRFPSLPWGLLREDAILPVRALLIGQGKFLSARLVNYRTHSGNLHNLSTLQTSAAMVVHNLSFAEDRRVGSAQMASDLANASAQGIQVSDDVREFVIREQSFSKVEQSLLRSNWKLLKLAIIFKAWLLREIRTASAAKLAALFIVPGLYAPLLRIRIRLFHLKRRMRHG